MAELAASAAIYRRLVGARIRSQLQYRASFALDVLGAFLATALDFAAILVIFHHVSALGGWSIREIAFLYAMSCVAFALTDIVVGHLDLFPQMVRDGTFDQILVRPLGSLFQVVSAEFSLKRIGKALQGVGALAFALTGLDIDWDAGKLVMVPVMVVSGAVIFAAVWIALATIAFWFVDAIEAVNAFTYGGNFLAQYPINIFGVWLRRFLAFGIPMAFVCYFPSLYVLGKPDPLHAPEFLRFVSPVVALITVALAGLAWRNAVRHYRSTGS